MIINLKIKVLNERVSDNSRYISHNILIFQEHLEIAVIPCKHSFLDAVHQEQPAEAGKQQPSE